MRPAFEAGVRGAPHLERDVGNDVARRSLLLYHSARNAVAGITRGVRLQVVRLRVNYQRCSPFMEERIGSLTQGGPSGNEARTALPATVHNKIGQVADMRPRLLRAIDAVMCAGRVEVPTCRREGRPLAFAHGVNM